jgi:hypothetical protein
MRTLMIATLTFFFAAAAGAQDLSFMGHLPPAARAEAQDIV